MTDLKNIKTDEKKSREGVTVTYPGTDIELRVAAFSTPAYQAHARKLLKPHRGRRRSDDLTPRETKDAIVPAVARHVWLGFKNLTEDGKAIEDTRTARERLLMMHDLDDLYDFILETAGDIDEFRLDDLEEDSGN